MTNNLILAISFDFKLNGNLESATIILLLGLCATIFLVFRTQNNFSSKYSVYLGKYTTVVYALERLSP